MHTQNVNTATRKTPERYTKSRPKTVEERQYALLLRLCGVWNLQLPEHQEEEEISNILLAMVENVRFYGVRDWGRAKPLIDWRIAQVWIDAQRRAVTLYAKTGAKVVAYARAELAIALSIEQEKHRNESCAH